MSHEFIAETQKPPASVITDPYSEDWQKAQEIEADVFIDAEYVESQAELGEEYGKYLPKTTFIIAHKDDQVAGSIRIIHYDPNIGFKTLDDIAAGKLDLSDEGKEKIEQIDPSDIFEVGTLAADKQFRGKPEDEGRIAVSLYGAIYGEATEYSCRYVLASFDEDYLSRFEGIFGPSVHRLGPPKDYMGSQTTPTLIEVPVLMDHIHDTLPPVYEQMVKTASSMYHNV